MVIQNDDKENEDKAVGLDFLKSDWDKYPPIFPSCIIFQSQSRCRIRTILISYYRFGIFLKQIDKIIAYIMATTKKPIQVFF